MSADNPPKPRQEIADISIATTMTFIDHVNMIRNLHDLSALISVFVSTDIAELRSAALETMEAVMRRQALITKGTEAELQSIVSQMLKRAPSNDAALRLLNAYVFGNASSSFAAVGFAMSLVDPSVRNDSLLLRVSKIVCSRLLNMRLGEVQGSPEMPQNNVYLAIPELEFFLTKMLLTVQDDHVPSAKSPWICRDFTLAERALKVIVSYRDHGQSHLPMINKYCNYLQRDWLTFSCSDSGTMFDRVKYVAVFKESAKLLRQASKRHR